MNATSVMDLYVDASIWFTEPTDGQRVYVGRPQALRLGLRDPWNVMQTNVVYYYVDWQFLTNANMGDTVWWVPPAPGECNLYAYCEPSGVFTSVNVTAVAAPPIDNVRIISPEDGVTSWVGVAIPLSVAFGDPSGVFNRAEFFVNGVSLGQTTNTWIEWTASQTNDYTITATVYDDVGNPYTASNAVTVHVVTPPRPVLTITHPAEGSRVRANAETFVIVDLYDPAQLTTNVEFYVDGLKAHENTLWYAWSPTRLGDHVLHCVAQTSEGENITSAPVTVTVAVMYPPSVTLLTPTNDQRFEPGVIPLLSAQATDNDGTVTNITLTLDYMVLGETNNAGLELLASNAAPGWHEAVARAMDNDGLSTSSAVVRFFVERGQNLNLPVPNQLVATADSATEIRLSWLPIATNEQTQSIIIERWDADRQLWTEIMEVPADGSDYIDSGLNPETYYRYRIACVDRNGNRSDYSAEAGATTRTVVPSYAVIDLNESLSCMLSNRVPGGNIITSPALDNFDLRRTVPLGPRHAEAVLGSSAATLGRALARFNERWPQIQLDYDPVLLSPHSIMPRVGYLTGPSGAGITVSEATANLFDANDPYRPVKAFLQEHKDLFGFGPEELTNAFVAQDYTWPITGARTVAWQQQVADVPVFGAIFIAHMTATGELASVACDFIPNPAAVADPAVIAALQAGYEFPIGSSQALLTAVTNVGDILKPGDISPLSSPQGMARKQKFSATKGIKGEAYAQLVWFPVSRNELELGWQVIFMSRWRNEMYLTLVSTRDNRILYRRNLTATAADATYRVFTTISPEPMYPGLPTPAHTQPAPVERVLVTLAALDPVASPEGWIPNGVNETRGNNVDAFLDRDDDDQPDPLQVYGNPHRVFDYPWSVTGDPINYGQAAVVQIFFWNNWIHDVLYRLGFTEPAGNFQNDNFGRGGLDNDALQVLAQNGAFLVGPQHRNSMNMSTPPDGYPPRMQVCIFDGPEPDRDAAFDAQMIIHEYVHGITARLVGAGVGIDALQTAGLADGWSDFYALVLLTDPAADPDAVYPFGAYVAYHAFGTSFDQNYYFVIRRYPYCTDTNKNLLTFADMDPTKAHPHESVPRNPIHGPFDRSMASEVHNQGEVWCTML